MLLQILFAALLFMWCAVADDSGNSTAPAASVGVTVLDTPVLQLVQAPGWYPGGAIAIRTQNKTLYTSVSGGQTFANNRLYLDAVLPPDIHAYPAPHHDALEVAAVGNWGGILVVGVYGIWFGIPDVTNGGDRYRFDFEQILNVKAIQYPVQAMLNTTVPGAYVAMLSASTSCANTTTTACYGLQVATWLFANRPSITLVRDQVEKFQWFGNTPGRYLYAVQNADGVTSTLRQADLLSDVSTDVVLHSAVIGWTVAGDDLWALTPTSGSRGLHRDAGSRKIIRSQDGGATWQDIVIPASVDPSVVGMTSYLDLYVDQDNDATNNQAVFLYLRADGAATGDLLTISGENTVDLVHVSRRVLPHAGASALNTMDPTQNSQALLAPVAGINGAWLMNRLDVFQNAESVVSFDQGRRWTSPIDAACPTTCSSCNLHISSWEGNSMDGDTDPVSHASSPGVVSVVARVASDPTDAWWLSQDAGVTFNRVQSGVFATAVSNAGGLAVAVAANGSVVNSMQYTWNAGATVATADLSAAFASAGFDGMIVEAISPSDVGAGAASFLLMGTPTNAGTPSSSFAMVFVDFAPTASATCGAADVSAWQFPWSSCILGTQAAFSRKNPASNCMLSPATVSALGAPAARPTCPCTAMDYGCDYCHELSQNNECLPSHACLAIVAAEIAYSPTWDQCNGTYGITQGYAKLYHSVCTPNPPVDAAYDYVKYTCPSPPPPPADTTTTSTTGDDSTMTTTTSTTGSDSSTTSSPSDGSSGSSFTLIIIIIVVVLLVIIIGAAIAGFVIYRNKMAAQQASTV